MARDMSDKEILKMELEQLQKEVKNTREPVSLSALNLIMLSGTSKRHTSDFPSFLRFPKPQRRFVNGLRPKPQKILS